MSLQTGHLFEFDEYRLDLREKLLRRGEAVIPLTPKVFETLQVLVENAGRLIEKDELMQRIWQDRLVEESNLTYNIKILRKALGDNAANPRFIETVPRRGYRFIAEVSEGTTDTALRNGPFVAGSHRSEQRPTRSTLKKALLPALAMFCIVTTGAGLWYAGSIGFDSTAPILSSPFNSENLSTNSRVLHAAISPDGRTVAYTNGIGAERQSVWLKQLDSSNNIQIIPPSDGFYYNLAFSADGNFLYFVRGPKPGNPAEQYAIYRTSIFGGVATKIVEEVQGWMSVSPDGTRISFVRCFYRDDEWCALWIADAADGKNERKLVSRPSPFRIGVNKIAPDNRTIAFGTGQSRTGGNEYGIAVVDIESGTVGELTGERFFDIKGLAWLPDQRGVLMTALKIPDRTFRIWQASALTGETAVLTRDSEDYSGLSLDEEASKLVATQTRPDFHLNLYPAEDLTKGRQIFADAATVAFAPDGKLITSSGRPGNVDLWSVNADGSDVRQLTNGPLDDHFAVVSGDGDSILFASNRTGETHVWQMKADGSDQTQISVAEGGFPLGITADRQWIYYHSALAKTLKRVSVRDRKEQLIVERLKPIFAVSPDCTQAAFTEGQGGEEMLVVISLPDGQPLGNFRLGSGKGRLQGLAWSNDGKKLFYIETVNAYDNNTLWVQSLDKLPPRKLADLPGDGVRNEYSFAASADGKSFAVVQGFWKRDAVLIKGLN